MQSSNICKKCQRNPPNPGRSWCQTCFLSQGASTGVVCKVCKRIPPNPGFSLCQQCYQKSLGQASSPAPGSPVCTNCKSRYANPGRSWCQQCFTNQIQGNVPIGNTLCQICNQNPPNPGYTLCQQCYQKSLGQGSSSALGTAQPKAPGANPAGNPSNTGQTCKHCNKRPANPGYSLCQKCFLIKSGTVCTQCRKSPAHPGRTLCKPCYQHRNKLCKKCQKNPPNKGFGWCSSCYINYASGATIENVSPQKYQSVAQQFSSTWGKAIPHQIVNIVGVKNVKTHKRYQQYKKSIAAKRKGNANERRRWHGTKLECNSLQTTLQVCGSSTCSVCNICKTGFDLKLSTKNYAGRFGKGLYFAPNSSKSHAYSSSKGRVKAMFLCKVVAGQVHHTKTDMANLTQPPNGCDSVSGEVGVNLNYPELVVYHSDAALPAYIVFYTS